MKGLERRMAGAEKRVRSAGKRFDAPTIAEHQWACRVHDRHFMLTALREAIHEQNDLSSCKTTDIPPYTEEEANFLTDCAAGDLQRAQEICDRFGRANGRVPWSDMTPAQRERELERHRQQADRNQRELLALMAEFEAKEEDFGAL